MPAEIVEVFEVPKGRVTVYINFCKGCGLCMAKCPKKAIGWSDLLGVFGTPTVNIDANLCTLCGQCEILCPDCAITTEYIPLPKRKKKLRAS